MREGQRQDTCEDSYGGTDRRAKPAGRGLVYRPNDLAGDV